MPHSEEPPMEPVAGPMPPMENEPAEQMEPEPPMEGENDEMPPMDSNPEGNSELSDLTKQIESSGDEEKIKAAKGYLESLVDNAQDSNDKDVDNQPEMPTESYDRLGSMINEIINNVLSSDEVNGGNDRRDNKVRNRKVSPDSPFKAKTRNNK